MKIFQVLMVSTIIQLLSCQNIDTSCAIPEDIAASRLTRLHHPCESNQNRDFAIMTYDNYFCIYYTTFGIDLFSSESQLEIKIDGEWDYEQVLV